MKRTIVAVALGVFLGYCTVGSLFFSEMDVFGEPAFWILCCPAFLVAILIAAIPNEIQAYRDLADNPKGLRHKTLIEFGLGAVIGFAPWLILFIIYEG